MASIKVKFKPSTVSGQRGTIYYQILHKKKQRQLFSDYHVYPFEWDEKSSFVVFSRKSENNLFILSICKNIRQDVDRLNKIIRKFEDKYITYTVDDVVNEFHRYIREYSLFNYMAKLIVKLKQKGKIRTSETYRSTLNSFKEFRQGEDIMLDCINSDIIELFEAWHKKRGVVPNTISFYLRILRAVYNRAVEEEIIENCNPFCHVYTGVDKTVKRALPLDVIKQIKLLDPLTPPIDFARDMFMLSFMLRGMSFIDMAYLRKTDLSNGYIVYRRRKTGQILKIEWTVEMQQILNKYPENESDYLLPIFRTSGENEWNMYKRVGYKVNYNLKLLAKRLGLQSNLTFYVARHSWASAAKSKGIPLSVISEGMGHDNESTTQIYLASLDSSIVDNANTFILGCL